MKRILFCLVTLTALNQSIYSQELDKKDLVEKIDLETLEKLTGELSHKIRKHNLMRYALVGTALTAAAAYKAYGYFYPETDKEINTNALTQDEITALKKMLVSTQIVGDSYIEKFKSYSSAGLYSFIISVPGLVGMSIANWFTATINLATIFNQNHFEFILYNIKLASCLIDSNSEILPDILNGQLEQGGDLLNLKIQLKAELVDGPLVNEKKETVNEQLIFLSNKLIQNVYNLLAYLKIKEQKHIDNNTKEQLANISHQIITQTNQLVQNLNNAKNNADKLALRVFSYTRNMQNILNNNKEIIK